MTRRRRLAPGDPARAVAYLRASTDRQDLSPGAQRAAIERWAAGAGVVVVAWFDDLGVSGGTALEDRPGLLAALDALDAAVAETLVLAERDRLVRDVLSVEPVERLREGNGARVVAADGAANGDGPGAARMPSLVNAIAPYEMTLNRGWMRAALTVTRAREERAGGAPLGSWAGSDGPPSADPAREAADGGVRRRRSDGRSRREEASPGVGAARVVTGARWQGIQSPADPGARDGPAGLEIVTTTHRQPARRLPGDCPHPRLKSRVMVRATPTHCDARILLPGVAAIQVEAVSRLPAEGRSRLGQYMTPPSVASLMASFLPPLPTHVRLLDPGAGCGALTAAFMAEACRRPKRPREIDVAVYEIESRLVSTLRETLDLCRAEAARHGITFRSTVYDEDFILAGTRTSRETLFAAPPEPFTHAILNPPYCKLRTSSTHRMALSEIGVEATNLYAAFVSLALRSLGPKGELVAITPRSFCNGPYFRSFRAGLLKSSSFRRIHVFDRRDAAFDGDEVLQENVIFSLTKRTTAKRVVLSASEGPGMKARTRRVPLSQIVRPDDPEAFIRLEVTEGDEEVGARVRALPCRLDDLGLEVSTGRVVHFRVREALVAAKTEDSASLVWAQHLRDGVVVWPRDGSRKPEGLLVTDMTSPQLVPEGCYVLVKRFSAKEEARRVTAAFLGEGMLPAGPLAIENHLNYFHADGSGLDAHLARGLTAYLNSGLVDAFFRQFNGHTQVNATDLRSLHYPDARTLVRLGKRVKSLTDPSALDGALLALGV